VLNGVLALERRAIAAYTAGIPLLQGHDRRAATEFLRQELLHAGRLIVLITATGGPVAPRAVSYDLGQPDNARQVLVLLHEVEQAQIAAYLDAVQRLSPGRIRAAAGSILADDAQHVSILRAALGDQPVPSAFVSGAE
jgi:hypothetical protein